MQSSIPHQLEAFIDNQTLAEVIKRARLEDMGPDLLDVTSQALIEPERECVAHFSARQPGILAGERLLPAIVAEYDPRLELQRSMVDAEPLTVGDHIASLRGPLQSILAMERTALNLLTHLSGIATLTAQYVELTTDTDAHIYDTRKTLPGLRGLQKYAVACGGGHTHRLGLYDAMLAKDNHLTHVRPEQLKKVVTQAANHARATYHDLGFVEVEVDTLDQLEQVLQAPIDIVLLDNMNWDQLTEAVTRRDCLAPAVALEASGGVNLEMTRDIARTGIDRIAVGALTHSAPAVDIGLDTETLVNTC